MQVHANNVSNGNETEKQHMTYKLNRIYANNVSNRNETGGAHNSLPG